MKGTELGLNFFDLRQYDYFPTFETFRRFKVSSNSDPSLVLGEVGLNYH